MNDLSGNARHVVQATGANKPLWEDDGLNGFDVGKFDATTATLKRMLKTAIGAVTNYSWTVAVVSRLDVVATAGNTVQLCQIANSTNARGGFTLSYYNTTGTRRISVFRESDNAAFNHTFGVAPIGSYEVI